jgi:hypothetical protein
MIGSTKGLCFMVDVHDRIQFVAGYVVLLSITKHSECETHLLFNRSSLFIQALRDSFYHYTSLLDWVIYPNFTSNYDHKE